MVYRYARLWWLLAAFLGCQSAPPPAPVDIAKPEASRLWVEGRQALQKGQTDQAITLFERSLSNNGESAKTHLSLAAAQLEKGDEAGACAHLSLYLAAHPEHTVVRAHYAELLLRRERTEAARTQYERFEVEAQAERTIPLAQMIRCETRLAHIAELLDDDFSEHLHRGIGLFLLARERRSLPPEDGVPGPEALLCRAANELTRARMLRPEEARPNWYLYQVWDTLAQRHAALCRLNAATETAMLSYLTPVEQHDLHLACERERTERIR